MAKVFGMNATLSLDGGSTEIAQLRDVELEVSAEFAAATALDEVWADRALTGLDWRLRAGRYVATTYAFVNAVHPGSEVTVEVTDPQESGVVVLAGTGFVTRGSVSIPHREVEEEIEIIANGAPTTVGGDTV